MGGSPKVDRRLAVLLAMAMFVLVVDTSVTNVSIASVVHDLHTTVSGVQSAIALEALVSAAFILIGSKVGDLIGRKRAYVLGLLGYGIGALAMALAQGLTAIIVFWAIIGGIGASLLLPAMQSLIHGNVEPIVPRATSGWYLVVPLMIAGSGLGLLVSQLNNYTLAPIAEERVSEAAGVNSAGGSFGLSFGLAFAGAILLAALSASFTGMAQSSTVLSHAEQQQVAATLEHDAQVVSNTQLEKQLAGQPEATQQEIIKINTQARHLALQIALLVPILAGLAGFGISFRMMRLPDPEQSGDAEQMVLS